MSNLYSIGQMNQLGDALEKVGFTPDEVTKLRQFNLGAVRSVLAGYSEIKPIVHLIDCDADPFAPRGWKVEEHKKGGQFAFDPAKIKFYLSPNQQGGKAIEGNKLRKELASEPVLNANVLDYLLANPHLIPEDWKKGEQGLTRYIFFWGTIYRHSLGGLCVRCFYFGVGGWGWDYYWLGIDWDGGSPAALRAILFISLLCWESFVFAVVRSIRQASCRFHPFLAIILCIFYYQWIWFPKASSKISLVYQLF